MTVQDFSGSELAIGDEVVFISAPLTLQRGLITNFVQASKVLTLVEIVVTLSDGKTHTMQVAPFVCAKLGMPQN